MFVSVWMETLEFFVAFWLRSTSPFVGKVRALRITNIAQDLDWGYGCFMNIPHIFNPDCNSEDAHNGCLQTFNMFWCVFLSIFFCGVFEECFGSLPSSASFVGSQCLTQISALKFCPDMSMSRWSWLDLFRRELALSGSLKVGSRFARPLGNCENSNHALDAQDQTFN